MKRLEAFRERQWNVVQVIVSDVKMLQFMQILEDEGESQGKMTDFLKNSKFEIYHCNEHCWIVMHFVSAWYGWKKQKFKDSNELSFAQAEKYCY